MLATDAATVAARRVDPDAAAPIELGRLCAGLGGAARLAVAGAAVLAGRARARIAGGRRPSSSPRAEEVGRAAAAAAGQLRPDHPRRRGVVRHGGPAHARAMAGITSTDCSSGSASRRSSGLGFAPYVAASGLEALQIEKRATRGPACSVSGRAASASTTGRSSTWNRRPPRTSRRSVTTCIPSRCAAPRWMPRAMAASCR